MENKIQWDNVFVAGAIGLVLGIVLIMSILEFTGYWDDDEYGYIGYQQIKLESCEFMKEQCTDLNNELHKEISGLKSNLYECRNTLP